MRIVISGYFGYGNIGDEALCQAEIEQLRLNYHDPEIIVLSGDPVQTANAFRVRSIYRYDFPTIIKAIKNCDLFISGGGSLLQDRTSTRSLLYYLSLIRLAHFTGKKIFLLGQGWGPIKNPLNEWPLRRTLKLVDLMTFRDSQSFYEANRHVGNAQKTFETGDPAVLLNPASEEKIASIFQQEEINKEKKPLLIGVSIRRISLYEETLKNFHHNLAENLDKIALGLNAKIVFMIFQSPADLDPTIKVASLMRQPYEIVFRECSAPELLGIVSKMDYVIGLRLHCVIFAASCAVPSVGLVYDPKVKAFMDKIDQPYYAPQKVGPDDIYKEIYAFESNREHYRQKAKIASSKLIAQARLNFSLMKSHFPDQDWANILGVKIDNVGLAEAKERCLTLLGNGQNNLVVTPNPEMVMAAQKNAALKKAINESAALRIPDGAGLQWGAWFLGENLYFKTPGIDLMDQLLKIANDRGLRVYLLGSKPGVATLAAENIKAAFPKIVIAGTQDGYFTRFEEAEVISKIHESQPDLLFAGLGAVRQELWLDEHRHELGAKIAMGVGGALDVYSGETKRAPKWVQDIGKEWVYRLIKEPWRLGRQMSIPIFLAKTFQVKLERGRKKNG